MLIGEYDYDTDIEVQREESYNQGFEDGEGKGITKGAHQQAIETAKILKTKNIDLNTIEESTGLTIEEIEKL